MRPKKASHLGPTQRTPVFDPENAVFTAITVMHPKSNLSMLSFVKGGLTQSRKGAKNVAFFSSDQRRGPALLGALGGLACAAILLLPVACCRFPPLAFVPRSER
jgi:hypothetical protein